MTPEEIKILLFAFCLLLSAFFSGSEVALISITRAKVRMLLAAGDKRATALAALKKNPDHVLITILIGNNIVNVAASAIATSIAIDRFGDVGLGYATGIVVLLLLVFGEIGPKMYGVRFTDRLALTVARPIYLLSKVFSPVLWVFDRLSHSSNLTAAFAKPAITEDEIKGWIDLGKEAGTIEQQEREMLYSVLEFGDTTAREVMTPRIDVVMVEEKSTTDQAINLFNESGFSRLPVYHEQVDNIIGILNVKDLFPSSFGKQNIRIRDLMHEPFFAPESKKIDDLLKELQVRKSHIAIVLDEYGSFAGIVTVEDILEELVGEILDEYDKEEPEIQKADDGTYIIDARAWVEDINDQLGLALPVHDDYETMGGLIIERLGHIPHKGEKVELAEGGVVLQVIQMRAKRVERLRLLIVPKRNGE